MTSNGGFKRCSEVEQAIASDVFITFYNLLFTDTHILIRAIESSHLDHRFQRQIFFCQEVNLEHDINVRSTYQSLYLIVTFLLSFFTSVCND